MKKRSFINSYDIVLVLFLAALAVVLCLFAAPRGKTSQLTFTAAFKDGEKAPFSDGDVITVPGGGVIGVVSEVGDGYVKLTADAEKHAGIWFSDGIRIKHGAEYELLCSTTRATGIISGIGEAEK